MFSKLLALKITDLLFYFLTLASALFVVGNVVSYYRERPQFQEPNKIQRDPDVFIIGAKKCGTQALADFLNIHPKVELAKEDFPYFIKDSVKEFHGYEWLRNRMPFTGEGQLTVVRTPDYFENANVAQEIHQMNKKAKLILMVRDPTTRLLSDYLDQQEMRSNWKNTSLVLGTFEEEFLNDEGAVLEPEVWVGSPPVSLGFYSLLLPTWMHFFNSDHLLVLTNEELVLDPAATMAKVQTFLQLEPLVTEDNFFTEPSRAPFQCYITRKPLLRKVCLPPSKGRHLPFVPRAALDRVRQFYASHMRDLKLKLPTLNY